MSCPGSVNVFLRTGESLGSELGQATQREAWASLPRRQVHRNAQSTATGDTQDDASGHAHHQTSRLHPFQWISDADSRGSGTVRSHAKQAAICNPATEKPAPSQSPHALCQDSPFGGWTRNNTIPSVIKVSTQGSRVLHTRGAPAHTGDDINDRNRNGGRKEETGMGLLGLKREGHS